MIKSPNCIDGCKIVSRQPDNRKTQFRKGAWTLVCSHGLVMNDMVESHFDPDSVGKSHVLFQGLKHTKSRGSAVKGTRIFFLIWNHIIYELISIWIHILRFLFNQLFTVNIPLGTDAMTSKDTKRKLIKENKNWLKKPNILDVRRTVSTRSPSADLKCPMQIIIFLGQDDRFYVY